MAQNLQMPRFGRANNTSGADTWGDCDAFDVDMLTEYLLNDGTLTSSGVTFDFNMDGAAHLSSTVSPENSEDGALPTVADSNEISAEVQKFAASHEGPSYVAVATSGMPIAPSPSLSFPALPTQVSMPGNDGQGLVFHHHQQQHANSTATSKRRRIDGMSGSALLAVSGGPTGSAFLGGDQLAAAAARAIQNQGRGRKKSQAQIDRRRERNRILARRTRLRKKFFFESLQKEIMDLQRENLVLKELVKVNISGEEGKKILEGCNAAENLPSSVLEACGEENDMDSQDFNLVRSIQSSQHSFMITDPSLQDNPIVFASDDFLKLTGYTREQVLGRNCRFLQGTETSQEKVNQIRKNLSEGEDVTVTLMNYTADGTPFWNKLFIAALRDAQNNIVNFIGVIVKVARPEPGDPEHDKGNESEQNDGDESDEDAEDTVRAIEGAVTAAVAAAGRSS